MELTDLLNSVKNCKEYLGVKNNKFMGALAVDLLRQALAEREIRVSERDVFIQGVPVEIDLLIPTDGTKPEFGLLYRLESVIAALEVKTRGCYGQNALDSIKSAFELIRKSNRQIRCAYVTLTELKKYKYMATKKNLGCDEVFTLSWYTRREEEGWDASQEHWEKLLNWLSSFQNKPAAKFESMEQRSS